MTVCPGENRASFAGVSCVGAGSGPDGGDVVVAGGDVVEVAAGSVVVVVVLAGGSVLVVAGGGGVESTSIMRTWDHGPAMPAELMARTRQNQNHGLSGRALVVKTEGLTCWLRIRNGSPNAETSSTWIWYDAGVGDVGPVEGHGLADGGAVRGADECGCAGWRGRGWGRGWGWGWGWEAVHPGRPRIWLPTCRSR